MSADSPGLHAQAEIGQKAVANPLMVSCGCGTLVWRALSGERAIIGPRRAVGQGAPTRGNLTLVFAGLIVADEIAVARLFA